MLTTIGTILNNQTPPLLNCRVELVKSDGKIIACHDDKAKDDEGKKGIRCAQCSGLVTTAEYKGTVEGKHEHTFFNPAGIIFKIRCFHQAPGTYQKGEQSTEFTWFANHSWQITLCRICHIHLGWKFSGELGIFLGLIKKRLVEEEDS